MPASCREKPSGEEVGHLVALSIRRQPNWETRNPDVPRGQDRGCPAAGPLSDRGTQSGVCLWRLQLETLPRAPCALGQGSRDLTPSTHSQLSYLRSAAQSTLGLQGLRLLGGGW